MDEDPVAVVPDVTPQPEVQLVEPPTEESAEQTISQQTDSAAAQQEKEIDSLTLDDIKREKSREDIIAEAEAAAYGE